MRQYWSAKRPSDHQAYEHRELMSENLLMYSAFQRKHVGVLRKNTFEERFLLI